MSLADILKGLTVGASLLIGTFLAKPFLLHLGPETFRRIMDLLLLVSGLVLLWGAFIR